MMRRSLAVGGTLLLFGTTAIAAQATSHDSRSPTAPRFEVDPMWPMPMANHWILGSTVGVAVDSRDHIFVVNLTDSFNPRTESGSGTNPKTGECCTPAPNVVEYDPTGNVVGTFGGPAPAGVGGYDWPEMNHGIGVDGHGNVWIGGMGGADTRILKFTHDGKFIAQFGKAGVPAVAAEGGGGAGARPTDTAYAGMSSGRGAAAAGRSGGRGRGGRAATPPLPANSNSMDTFGGPAGFSFDDTAGEAYVADGYRNRRVAVIDMTTGVVKRYWGAYGTKPVDAGTRYDPGAARSRQFGNPVRCARLSSDGLVYVCDTENDRIQVFRKDGSFVAEKLIAPATRGTGSVWDVAFSRDPQQMYLYVADGMNMKVRVLDRRSLDELSSFGDGGRQPGQFYAVHSVATDSKGNLYTTETYEGKRVQKFNFKAVGPVTKLNAGVVWPTAAPRIKP